MFSAASTARRAVSTVWVCSDTARILPSTYSASLRMYSASEPRRLYRLVENLHPDSVVARVLDRGVFRWPLPYLFLLSGGLTDQLTACSSEMDSI